MKHVMILFVVCGALSADVPQEEKPFLYQDYTEEAILVQPKETFPKFNGKVQISSPERALKFSGSEFVELPGTSSFSMQNGGTLHAVVRFDDAGTKSGSPDAHDTILFKAGEFLLARYGASLYFNAGNGNAKQTQWIMPALKGGVATRKWTAFTVTLTRNTPESYTVEFYFDGKSRGRKTFQAAYGHSPEPVTLGKGWGGPWFMSGSIAMIMLFSQPLSARQIRVLAEKSPYLKTGSTIKKMTVSQ